MFPTFRRQGKLESKLAGAVQKKTEDEIEEEIERFKADSAYNEFSEQPESTPPPTPKKRTTKKREIK